MKVGNICKSWPNSNGSARRIEADNRIWRISLGKGRLSADSPAHVGGKRKTDLARGRPGNARDTPDFPTYHRRTHVSLDKR
jgi:hypothetical protein